MFREKFSEKMLARSIGKSVVAIQRDCTGIVVNEKNTIKLPNLKDLTDTQRLKLMMRTTKLPSPKEIAAAMNT